MLCLLCVCVIDRDRLNVDDRTLQLGLAILLLAGNRTYVNVNRHALLPIVNWRIVTSYTAERSSSSNHRATESLRGFRSCVSSDSQITRCDNQNGIVAPAASGGGLFALSRVKRLAAKLVVR